MKIPCRFCRHPLSQVLVDLGEQPLANANVPADRLAEPDRRFPLVTRVCEKCFLVQASDSVPPDAIFSDYDYFSSVSASWVDHARRYCEMAAERFRLNRSSFVIEIASNDGYLLQHFVKMSIPVLGIEPAANVAAVAEQNGVPSKIAFFGEALARQLIQENRQADLLLGNNVLAHVPDINDFVRGLALLLKPEGVLTMEFPHLLNLLNLVQFDTIYHEHFSYLSLLAVERIFSSHGLRLFDVEQVPTHGGSLRVFACRATSNRPVMPGLAQVRALEKQVKLDDIATYQNYAARVEQVRAELLAFLQSAKADGKKVVAYGAAAKGNTLMNYCGIDGSLIDYAVDGNVRKQGRYTPGSRLEIRAPEAIKQTKPDYVLILPWNLKDEIMRQAQYIRAWGGKFVIPVPRTEVLEV